MSSMINGTLVKLERNDGNPCLHTYDRRHGRSYQRFFIDAKKLSEWIYSDSNATFYDHDIWCYLYAWKHGNMVRFCITWLTGSGSNLHGYEQHITLPRAMIEACLDSNGNWRHLVIEEKRQPALVFSRAGDTIRDIAGNKRLRRAFSKEISRSFQWRDSKSITFYNESPRGSLYFKENDGHGVCGGFILHRGIAKTKAGDFEKVYYSVHT